MGQRGRGVLGMYWASVVAPARRHPLDQTWRRAADTHTDSNYERNTREPPPDMTRCGQAGVTTPRRRGGAGLQSDSPKVMQINMMCVTAVTFCTSINMMCVSLLLPFVSVLI